MPKRKGGKLGRPRGTSSSKKNKKPRVEEEIVHEDEEDYSSSSSDDDDDDGDTDLPKTHEELDELLRDEERLLQKLQKPPSNSGIWKSLQSYCGFKYSGSTYKSDMIRCSGMRGPAVKFHDTDDIRTRFLKYGIPRDNNITVDDESNEVKARMQLELWARRAAISGSLHHDARARITINGYQHMFETFDVELDDNDSAMLLKSYGGSDPIKLEHGGEVHDLLVMSSSSPNTNSSSRRSSSRTSRRRRGTRSAGTVAAATTTTTSTSTTPSTSITYTVQEYRDYLRTNPSNIKRTDIDDPNQLLALEMWVASSPTPLPTFEFSNSDDDEDSDEEEEEDEEEGDRKPAAKKNKTTNNANNTNNTQKTSATTTTTTTAVAKKKKKVKRNTKQQRAATSASAVAVTSSKDAAEGQQQQEEEEGSFFQMIISPFKWFLGGK